LFQGLAELAGEGGAGAGGGDGEGDGAAFDHGGGDKDAEGRIVHDVEEDFFGGGFFSYGVVDTPLVGGGDGEEGVFEVAGLVLALEPLYTALCGPVFEGGGGGGADKGDGAVVVEEALDLAFGHGAAADDDAWTAGEVQEDRVVGGEILGFRASHNSH